MNFAKIKLVGAAALTACLVIPMAMAHDDDHHAPAPADARCVTDTVTTGEGSLKYTSVANWCQLPEGQKSLGATHGGVVVDKAGNIYFTMDSGTQGILVYSPEGKRLRGFADKMTGIHGLCIREEDGQEMIYAAHLAGKQVVKFTTEGKLLWSLPYPKESGKYKNAGQYNPTGVAVGPNGDIFVVDGYGQNWVHQYDKDQKYIRSFGGRGKEPGKFDTCHGIGLDTRGEKPLLLICDRANRRLQHFDLDGNFVAVVTEGLRLPCALSFHGKFIAVAELEGRVAIIDASNKVVSVLGDNPNTKQRANFGVQPKDWKEGIFNAAHGISYDKEGNLYVMDWNASGRVSRMNLEK